MQRLPWIAVVGLLTSLTLLATWPQAARLSAVSDFGDPLLNAWSLAWIAHALASSPWHLFDANIFHPELTTLAYSEALLLPGVAVAPLLWLGADPLVAHNLLLLGAYVLAGVATFLLVRRLTGHDGAALVSAVIFALYLYRIEEYPKVQLQLTFWWPLALLAGHRLLAAPSGRPVVAFALAAVAEFYSCIYYGLFGAVAVSAVIWILAVQAPSGRRRAVGRALGASAALALILALPLATVYRSAARVVGERSLDSTRWGSALPRDYLRAHPENAMYGDDAHPGFGEGRLFSGYAAPVLALTSLVPPVNVVAVAYIAGGALAFDLSLGLNAPGYRWLYRFVPGFRALRVPARFGMFVGLAIAVLAGLGLAGLSRRVGSRAMTVLVVVAIAAVTLESRMRPQQLVELRDAHPAIYTWLARQPRGVVCEYPVGNLEGASDRRMPRTCITRLVIGSRS